VRSFSKRAEALVRTTCAIPEAELRSAYLRSVLLRSAVTDLAPVLDILCARAEQAEESAREALVALVDALNHETCAHAVQHLREEALGVPHLALERLVRQPVARAEPRDVGRPEDDRIPDYGKGRPLTLGERKSLARRPDRAMMERLLRDPHPDVIRMVLASTKVVEEDVLAVAARRPCRPDVLAEIARQPRWSHRARIRMALVLNPDTPLELAAPIVGLLMRHELRLVATSPTVAPAVRALCLEHLDRRPPAEFGEVPNDEETLQ
jgi:hypothetical protein